MLPILIAANETRKTPRVHAGDVRILSLARAADDACGADALARAASIPPTRLDQHDKLMHACAAVFSGLLDGPDTRTEGHTR